MGNPTFFAVSQRQAKPPQSLSSQLAAQDGSKQRKGICLVGNMEIIKCEWIHVSNLITSHSYEIIWFPLPLLMMNVNYQRTSAMVS